MITKEEKNISGHLFMEGLYQNYHRLMYHIAQKWIDSPTEQQDVVQDSLVKLIEKEGLLRTLKKESLVSYIAYVVRNTAIKQMEQKTKLKKLLIGLDISELYEQSVNRPSLEEIIMRKEWCRAFWQVWTMLPTREKQLLEGKYIFGETDKELAEQLGYKTASVRMALTRARRTMLAKLKEIENESSRETAGAI